MESIWLSSRSFLKVQYWNLMFPSNLQLLLDHSKPIITISNICSITQLGRIVRLPRRHCRNFSIESWKQSLRVLYWGMWSWIKRSNQRWRKISNRLRSCLLFQVLLDVLGIHSITLLCLFSPSWRCFLRKLPLNLALRIIQSMIVWSWSISLILQFTINLDRTHREYSKLTRR